jgi:prepilin-type N-terminal cleavage/methylation domain-containing protein
VNRLRRRLSPAARSEQGFTLVELLVVTMLLSIVGAIVMSVTVGAMRSAARQEDNVRTLNEAKVAMERMTREIRGANAMVHAGERRLVFSTRFEIDGGTEIQRTTTLAVVSDGGSSRIVQTEADRVVSTGAVSTREIVVLGALEMGRSDAVFSYADGEGQAPDILADGSYAVATIGTVEISVRIRRGFGHKPAQLDQLVSIRNLEV